MKTIGIIGCRKRDSDKDLELCEKQFLELYRKGDEIVSGGCPKGGDRFAEIIAKKHNVPIKIHYAEWSAGNLAGLQRNTKIAEDSDVLIAVVSKDRKGGTEDTIRKFNNQEKLYTI